MRSTLPIAVALSTAAVTGCAPSHQPPREPHMQTDDAERVERDRNAIRAHIHALFEAFLHKDRDAIRRGHTTDWHGFQIQSTHLVRGIDEYMRAADQALTSFSGLRYEIKEMEIQVHHDIAIVYYVANWWFTRDNQEKLLPLRSVDVYRRDKDGWNQSGSNICVLPH